MCKNFRDLKVLAIPPPPKMLMTPGTQHKPFQYCRNVDHMLCYDRAKESWYAHSIEEIVIWTVERYWGEIDFRFFQYSGGNSGLPKIEGV